MPKQNTEGLSFEGMEIEFEKGGDSGGVRPACHIKDNGTTIVTVSPTDGVDVDGITISDALRKTTFAFAADDVLDDSADEWLGTGGAVGVTLTIPDSATMPGARKLIKKVDAGAGPVTLDFTPPETLDGVAPFALVNQYEAVTIVSDGANWHVENIHPLPVGHAASHAPGAADDVNNIAPTTPGAYPYAVLVTDRTILAIEGAVGVDHEIELPAATGSGRRITVVCTAIDAGTLSIEPAAGEQINALGADTHFAELDAVGDCITLEDSGAGQWWQVGGRIA